MTSTNITGRQPSASEQTIINEVLSLYQINPTDESYTHYHPTAIFHDPVSIAKGKESIMSQFNGMPKLFSSSTTQKCELLPSTTSSIASINNSDGIPTTSVAGPENGGSVIVLDLTQHYVFKGDKTPEKTLNSKVTLLLDKDGFIRHHEEEWDHEPNKTGEHSGFMGKLQEWRKKVDAKLVEAGVSSDPKKV
ncbi:hypothetical protein CB0940_09573 [Cercospora beticola]|uniref:SnoaL-like domain-containing protein n=1 Tax=Cercospora beticola TaxID=122368 RepID=A0A2G5HGG5_CERBT|nr:hypothetical protein CB0940_09573 [Cercospora beticola]PIA91634.1 hypothetical protein CB0940_09573 [Cercospora beticola]WPB06098.1 hypothetical protein RHO25_010755 [Cercospora beticola]CAK1365981.1 unnamed protein product [Cercospora beticola]